MVKTFERVHGPGEALMGEEATLFRAIAARANYLAPDRPDIGFATKELCREFANPTRADCIKLKRLGKYLVGRRRYVWRFRFDNDDKDERVTYTDTGSAGCQPKAPQHVRGSSPARKAHH